MASRRFAFRNRHSNTGTVVAGTMTGGATGVAASATPTVMVGSGENANRLVNGSGVPFQLVGANLSGLESCGSQSQAPWYGSPPNIAQLVALGITAARVPLNAHSFCGLTAATPNSAGTAWTGAAVAMDPDGTYVAAVDAIIRNLQAAGITPILEYHWGGAQFTLGGVTAYYNVGNQPSFVDSVTGALFYKKVANRYGTQATPQPGINNFNIIIGGFNEPCLDQVGSGSNGAATWAAMLNNTSIPSYIINANGTTGITIPLAWTTYGHQTMVNDIRATGAANVITYTAPAYGHALSGDASYRPTDTLNPPQLAAEVHLYPVDTTYASGNVTPETYPDPGYHTASWATAINAVAARVPLLITEFGGNFGPSLTAEPYVTEIVTYADSINAHPFIWEAWAPVSATASGQNQTTTTAGGFTKGMGTVFQTYALSKTSTGAALAFSTASLPGATTGTAYTDTVAFTGGTAPYTSAITTGALPAGLTYTGSTNSFAGTPTTAGSVNLTITVTDHVGATAAHTFALVVAQAAATANPTVPAINSITANDGSVTVAFTDSDSSITGYTVILSTGQSGSGTASPITVAAPDGTAVTATVTATNTFGSSTSTASSSVTPTAPSGAAPTQVQLLLQGQTAQNLGTQTGNPFVPQSPNYTMIGYLGVSGATSYKIYRATIPVGSQATGLTYTAYATQTAAAAAAAYSGYVSGSGSAPHSVAVNCAYGDTAATGCVATAQGAGNDYWPGTGYSYKVSAIVGGVEGPQSAAHFGAYASNGVRVLYLNSFNNDPNTAATNGGTTPGGNTMTLDWSETSQGYFNPYAGNGATEWALNIRQWNYMEVWAKCTAANCNVNIQGENVNDVTLNGSGANAVFNNYATWVPGSYVHFKIPLADFWTDSTRGRQNSWYKVILTKTNGTEQEIWFDNWILTT
jgi:hypothetical protein